MLQSLVALPLSALAVVLLFLLLYRLTPLDGKRAAAVTGMAALGLLAVAAVFSRPGADVIAMYVAVLAVTAYLLGIVAGSRERRRAEGGGAGFHWSPVLIIGFFVALFAADGLFVMISREGLPAPLARWLLPDKSADSGVRSVFPGTVARDYQKQEERYNDYLQRVETQTARGWRVHKGWVAAAVAGRQAQFRIAVEDRDGRPVTGATVDGVFQRPSDSRLDQGFSMHETRAGTYQVEVTLPEPGHWDLSLTIAHGEDQHELQAQTLVEPGD